MLHIHVRSLEIEWFIVIVPLGLWMFERPGELQLNHSYINFKTVY